MCKENTQTNTRGQSESFIRVGEYIGRNVADERLCTGIGKALVKPVDCEAIRVSNVLGMSAHVGNLEQAKKLVGILFSAMLQLDERLAAAALVYCRCGAPSGYFQLSKRNPIFIGLIVGMFDGIVRAETVPEQEVLSTFDHIFFPVAGAPFECNFDMETWAHGQLTNLSAELRNKNPALLRSLLERYHRYLYGPGEDTSGNRWDKLPKSTLHVMSLLTDQFSEFMHPRGRLDLLLGRPRYEANS